MKKINILLFFFFSLFLINNTLQEKKIKIFLAGDSTMAHKLKDRRPETGWGEKIGLFFNNNVEIHNLAKNGRSSKSFIKEERWKAIMDSVSPGDYVFIQFGHNDEFKSKGERYSPPIQFKDNFRTFVIETRARKAIPVLLTPVMRRRFDSKGKFYDVHGIYPDLIRQVSREMNVDLIDLSKLSKDLLRKLGEEDSKKIFLILKPGESQNYPDGNDDNTHFNDYGAGVIAKLAADDIRNSNMDLKNYLKIKDN